MSLDRAPFPTRLALALFVLGAGSAVEAATPPAQPTKGPGGSDYVAAEIAKKAYGAGSGQAFVFRPAGEAAQPRPAVIFLHAPGAVSPKFYGGWIEHLARKGLIVVYPRYELDRGGTKFSAMAEEAVKGAKEALASLAAEGVKVDLGKVAVVGHSGGAIIAAALAADAADAGLPKPRLVFGAMPSRPASEPGRGLPMPDLATLDPATVLVTVTGDRDAVAGEAGARTLMRAAAALPIERRLMIKLGSDNHGQPPLVAGHYAPSAPNPAYDFPAIEGAVEPAQPAPAAAAPSRDKAAREQARKDFAEQWRTNYTLQQTLPNFEFQETDAMDWQGLWRTFDLVLDKIFAGGDAMAVKRDMRLYDMGLWTDGWPVRRLNVESPKAEAARPEAGTAPETTAPGPAPAGKPTRRERGRRS